LPPITSKSSTAARRSNAWRTSPTVPLLLVCAMPVIAFLILKYFDVGRSDLQAPDRDE